MKLSEIILFYDTPMNDFQNTIHFDDEQTRDNYWLSGLYYKTVRFNQKFNFVRDRLEINVPMRFDELNGCNYGTFLHSFDNKRYYFYVMNARYINEEVTKLTIVIDVVMTYTNNSRLQSLKNLIVHRQHLSKLDYTTRLPLLQTNMDVIKTTTKRYIYKKTISWTDFVVVFQSTADLSVELGTTDAPKLVTSSGNIYDKVTSPVNLYLVEYMKFNDMMKKLQKYPWVAQNIKQVLLIPNEFIDQSDLDNVTTKFGFDGLKTFTQGGQSENYLLAPLATMSELFNILNLDTEQEKHLFRTEYCTLECYSWDGQSVILDPAFVKDKIQFQSVVSLGYNNQISLYPQGYKTNEPTEASAIGYGEFLNNAFIFNSWTELPILIDNYSLSLANNANRRQLAEDRLISGRVKNIANPSNANTFDGLASKFYDSVSLLSNGLSFSGILGKMSNEYEFYRDQKAEFADMKLSTPTITNQTNGYSFQIANDLFGITLKVSAPTTEELKKVRKYYKMFGYEIEENGQQLSNIHSMTIANYLQFEGNWQLSEVPSSLMEQLKTLFQIGVRFWHCDWSSNPMAQNIENNQMRS